MAFSEVKLFFEEKGLGDRVREFDVSSATVELAAAAVGCEAQRIAKTLSFDVSGEPVLIVTAGDARIDNGKFKKLFSTKAKMLKREAAEDLVGHAVGGVCPFLVKPGVRVCLDESLRRFETIFPAAGSANSAVELSPSELEALVEGAEWVDVCKLTE